MPQGSNLSPLTLLGEITSQTAFAACLDDSDPDITATETEQYTKFDPKTRPTAAIFTPTHLSRSHSAATILHPLNMRPFLLSCSWILQAANSGATSFQQALPLHLSIFVSNANLPRSEVVTINESCKFMPDLFDLTTCNFLAIKCFSNHKSFPSFVVANNLCRLRSRKQHPFNATLPLSSRKFLRLPCKMSSFLKINSLIDKPMQSRQPDFSNEILEHRAAFAANKM